MSSPDDTQLTLQCFSGVFLKRDGHYLLIKRSPHKKIKPNVWSCPGGGIEPHEHLAPAEAGLREIHEETGIPAAHIFGLTLRYIIIRRTRDIIRQSYIYFAETDIAQVIDTDEGKLHWVPESELLAREYSQTYAAMLAHYLYTPDPAHVIVGVAENVADTLHMVWSAVEDFEPT